MLGIQYTGATLSPWRHGKIVTMRRSVGQQGQFSMRKALTAATTPGHGYMKRCHDKMRSILGIADARRQQGALLAVVEKTEK